MHLVWTIALNLVVCKAAYLVLAIHLQVYVDPPRASAARGECRAHEVQPGARGGEDACADVIRAPAINRRVGEHQCGVGWERTFCVFQDICVKCHR